MGGLQRYDPGMFFIDFEYVNIMKKKKKYIPNDFIRASTFSILSRLQHTICIPKWVGTTLAYTLVALPINTF